MVQVPILTLLIVVPIFGGIVSLLFPPNQPRSIKAWTVIVTVVEALLVVFAITNFDRSVHGFQFVENVPWIPSLGINYHLGVDGVAISLIGLTGLIFIIAAIASYSSQIGNLRLKEYSLILLLAETAVMGVFSALDYILFFLFWEVSLIPLYFMIAIWGGNRREYAATKFILYTIAGSIIMFVGIIALNIQTGSTTFSISDLAQMAALLPDAWKTGIFVAFVIGFAVKLPLWPLHTWLPDAHSQAPVPGSVILAAIFLKMGGYAFFRIVIPTFPDVLQDFGLVLAALGLVNIIYGALATMAQTHDFKRFVAYSSISHMGFVMLGVAVGTPAALNGAVFGMVSHGLIAAMLFLMAGVWYERTHTLNMNELSGMNTATPVAATILTFAAMANLGMPGFSGFIAEFMVLLGTFGVFRVLVYVAVLGIVLVAGFNLLMLYRVAMGKPREEHAIMPDVSNRDLATLVPLMAGTVLLGLWPGLLIQFINGPVKELAFRL